MNKLLVIPILALILIAFDFYTYPAFATLFKSLFKKKRLRMFSLAYFLITFLSITGLFFYHFVDPELLSFNLRTPIIGFIFVTYASKILTALIMLLNDLFQFPKKIFKRLTRKPDAEKEPGKKSLMSRSEFIKKTAATAAMVPFTTLSFGILTGVHDYRIIRKKIYLPNLPKAFDGFKIGQISDIHSGSFFNKKAVKGGVEMLLDEKADSIFFTGDLVNNETKEVDEYIDIFKKVEAPYGVYSILGNHDYGNYKVWLNPEDKKQNMLDMYKAHELLGWDLLNNENRILEIDGEKIAIIGIENWGTGRFPKYGKVHQAYNGINEADVKLLLSHDPSHWDAEIIPEYKDIDVMFAGHTHGFQFGLETKNFKWSPSQYIYKQWAGLYKNKEQYLYVNRGFGFLGFPGRVGIAPEITILELKKGEQA
ncbi:metallophosphoesterase [Fulvivirgaceae bacterium BMA10]|uniref:Metallophosphoesterase n=1 Tax=Splendidivirga corallicola TaxID=3051826 RepID=A0ABT8KPF4_9BACT|nr:metallophosphoesterase [Fulvivirgaceae bacterium BMA10]